MYCVPFVISLSDCGIIVVMYVLFYFRHHTFHFYLFTDHLLCISFIYYIFIYILLIWSAICIVPLNHYTKYSATVFRFLMWLFLYYLLLYKLFLSNVLFDHIPLDTINSWLRVLLLYISTKHHYCIKGSLLLDHMGRWSACVLCAR